MKLWNHRNASDTTGKQEVSLELENGQDVMLLSHLSTGI